MSVKVTTKIDSAQMLRGRTGLVSNVMAGFAGAVTRSVKGVAAERITSRTGAYLAGISSTWTGDRIVTTASAPHSLFLERGTRPHVIEGNPVLRFKVGGQTVYARRVNHPGTRPYRILEEGARRAAARYFGG